MSTILPFRTGDATVQFQGFDVQAILANRTIARRYEAVRGPKTRFCRPVDGRGKFPAKAVGQRLFVQEGWARIAPTEHSPSGILYGANYQTENGTRYTRTIAPGVVETIDNPTWKRPQSMPLEACRIVLEVTDVRDELLQSISVDDAYAEGAWEWGNATHNRQTKSLGYMRDMRGIDPSANVLSVLGCFAFYWDINFASAATYVWQANPRVAVARFKRLLPENEWDGEAASV